MPIHPPETIADLWLEAQQLRREVRNTLRIMNSASSAAADRVSHAWAFAGAENAVAKTKAGLVHRRMQRIRASLVEIEADLSNVAAIAKEAASAVEDAQAKRQQTAHKYKV
jgi:hypothetical protein